MATKVRASNRGANRRDKEALTITQRLFVSELVADRMFNTTEAARKVGYKNPSVAAAKLMNNPTIAKEIGKAVYELHKKNGVKAERVMEELVRIGYFNPKNLFDVGGVLKDITTLPDEVACCIQSMDIQTRSFSSDEDGQETITTVKIRFWDKLQALDMLCKHLGFYVAQKTDLEIDLKGLLPALIERVSQRNNVLGNADIQRAIEGPKQIIEVEVQDEQG